MRSKNWIALALPLVILASLAIALPLGAQQASGLKVAVINGERVLAESNIGLQVQTEAQALAADWEGRVNAKQQELDAKVQQGQEQRLTLNQQALDRLSAEIEQLQVEVQRARDDAQRALNRLGTDAQERINAQLIPAVEQLATREGYDLILDTRIEGILYFANRIDVTERYIALVNAGPGATGRQQ